LNEIFADYFISEFDDPLNAYTSSMANYSGAAAAVALAQKQQQVEAEVAAKSGSVLPTGGIKTVFHSGPASEQPPLKKAKQEELAPAPMPPRPSTVGSGLTGRLGLSVVGGQVQRGPPPAPAPMPQAPAIVPQAPPTSSMGGGSALPVGRGIRLGGVGGVAPETAQNAQAAAMMWAGAAFAPGAGVSDQAVAERRQRNREHAKRSRVRKKFMLESLQEQVRQLQRENVELRMIVQKKIPQHAQQVIEDCCSKNPLFGDDSNAQSADKKGTPLVNSDFSLMESLTSGQQNFVLSDPRLPDNPIVYASPGFYTLTGYTQEQVLGRNCRFLQGPGTDQKAVEVIRTAIANGTDATTCILNYKADGTPFWNQFFIAALRDSDNCIVNYVSRIASVLWLPLFLSGRYSRYLFFFVMPGGCSMCGGARGRFVSSGR
jgi:PAS domain S-box-containing protein